MDRQPHAPGGRARFRGWRPTPGSVALVGVAVFVFFVLVVVLGAPRWVGALLLVPEKALGPQPWRLLTAAFIHPDVRSLLFNGIGLWFFGSLIEDQIGRSRMFLTFFAGALSGSLVAALIGRFIAPGLPVLAYSFGTTGLLGAVALLNWSTPLRVFGAPPVRGRVVALVLIGLATVPLFIHSAWEELGGTLGALGLGAVTVSAAAVDRARRRWERLRFWRIRRRYKVIPGGLDRRSYTH